MFKGASSTKSQLCPIRPPEFFNSIDSLRSMQERVDDYLAFGVKSIWVLDPENRVLTSMRVAAFVKPKTGFCKIRKRLSACRFRNSSPTWIDHLSERSGPMQPRCRN